MFSIEGYDHLFVVSDLCYRPDLHQQFFQRIAGGAEVSDPIPPNSLVVLAGNSFGGLGEKLLTLERAYYLFQNSLLSDEEFLEFIDRFPGGLASDPSLIFFGRLDFKGFLACLLNSSNDFYEYAISDLCASSGLFNRELYAAAKFGAERGVDLVVLFSSYENITPFDLMLLSRRGHRISQIELDTSLSDVFDISAQASVGYKVKDVYDRYYDPRLISDIVRSGLVDFVNGFYDAGSVALIGGGAIERAYNFNSARVAALRELRDYFGSNSRVFISQTPPLASEVLATTYPDPILKDMYGLSSILAYSVFNTAKISDVSEHDFKTLVFGGMYPCMIDRKFTSLKTTYFDYRIRGLELQPFNCIWLAPGDLVEIPIK